MGKILNIADHISDAVIQNDSSSAYLVTAITGRYYNCSTTYLYIFITDVPIGETDQVAKDFFDTLQEYEQSKWPSSCYSTMGIPYPSLGLHMMFAKTKNLLVSLNFYNIRRSSDISFSMSNEDSSSMFLTLKKEREAKTERYKQYIELRREFEGK